MRTQDELVERYNARKPHDPLGFEVHQYIRFMDYEHAKEFLKPEVKPDDWDNDRVDPANIRDIMIDYMAFAWDKANNARGISAGRSMMHYQAWLWIEGSDEAVALAESLETYDNYGKPELREICQFLGLDANKWDDGLRGNSEYELEAAAAAKSQQPPAPLGE